MLDNLSFDFFELLDSVTIARSRKHIERYYDTSSLGKFPTRLKPISRRPQLTNLKKAITYEEIFEELQLLNLAIYAPSEFILQSCRSKYFDSDDGDDYANLTMEGRENGLKKLMSINLLKRLESSVEAFRLTLERIHALVDATLAKIGKAGAIFDLAETLDEDDAESLVVGGKKKPIELCDMDFVRWKGYLQRDRETLELLLSMLKDITPEHDNKLHQLFVDLKNKFNAPINPSNKKVIIFTAFSDTAKYLYENLSGSILEEFGLHTALVTGDLDSKTTLKFRRALDFNETLTLFSPISKERDALYPGMKEEIDVLIATDCISEGQNLQDCDYLINYDIHWNPVRIIQRFGRIDRIGSKNEKIQLVNYWPDMTLDEYIDLKERVESRMKASILTATGDENPLSDEEKDDIEYRRKQLKRLQEEVVDIEEMSTGISIMDLGLNEFRLDLLEYQKTEPDIEHTPFGLHTVVPASEDNPPGVIYVLKNRNNAVNIDKKNRLHPFYMVYIKEDAEVVVDHLAPKDLLDRLRFLCKGKSSPDKTLCREFNRLTRDGKDMSHYSKLLGDTIASIIHTKNESDVEAFLFGDPDPFSAEIKGLDDFELICFFVVR